MWYALAWSRQGLRQRAAPAMLLVVLAFAWAWRLTHPVLVESFTREGLAPASEPRTQMLSSLGPGSGTLARCTVDESPGDCSGRSAVRVCDSASGKARRTFTIGGAVRSAALSPRGDLLALGCFLHHAYADRLAKLVGSHWAQQLLPDREATLIVDVATGQTLADLPAGQDLAFSADGRRLALYSSEEMTVQLWELPPRWLLGRQWKWLRPWSTSRPLVSQALDHGSHG
jgi:hypothetical protein